MKKIVSGFALNKGKVALAAALLVGSTATVQAQTLNDAVDLSVKNFPDVNVIRSQLQARQAAIGIAKSGHMPTINLDAQYGWEQSDNLSTRDNPAGNHINSMDTGSTSLVLSQLLWDGNRTNSDVKRTTAEMEAHEFALTSVAENIALRTSNVYLEMIKAETISKLSEENLKSHERIYEQIRQRTEQGVGSSSDLSQVEGRRARARSNVLAATNNLLDAQANFLRVVGETPDSLIRPETVMISMPANEQQALDIGLQQHPTLLSARKDVEAAKQKIRVQESAFSPEMRFELGATWADDLDGLPGYNNDLSAMFKVRYNLFNGYRDTYKVKEARSQLSEAMDIHRGAEREMAEGLSLSWNAYRSLIRQLEYLDSHVVASASTLQAYQKQFGLGRRTLMDLLDMENELFEARKAYVEGDKDWLFAQFRVLNASGMLLDSLGVAKPQSPAES